MNGRKNPSKMLVCLAAVLVAGGGESAALLPMQLMADYDFNAIGTASLTGASWDMHLFKVDAGAIQMRKPAPLGTLDGGSDSCGRSWCRPAAICWKPGNYRTKTASWSLLKAVPTVVTKGLARVNIE